MAAKKKTVKKVVAKAEPKLHKDTEALDWLIGKLKWRHMATDLLKEVQAMRE